MSNTYTLGDAFRYEEYDPGAPSNALPPPSVSPVASYQVCFAASPPTPSLTPGMSPTELSRRVGRPGVSADNHFADALEILRQGKLTMIDLFLYVLDSSHHNYRRGLFGEKFLDLLDKIIQSKDGKARVERWMQGEGAEVVSTVIEHEMDSVRERFRLPANAMVLSYVDSWSFKSNISNLTQMLAPVLTRILMRAGQDKKAWIKNKKKTPDTVHLEI